MQPFDALTARAVIQEARPLLVNRKVDRVLQTGRDDIVLVLRGRGGVSYLYVSAHATYGRICLVNQPGGSQRANPPAFCMLLRKHLASAVVVGAEPAFGERIVDLVFSTVSELGSPSLKVLTAEIMGRHSNLIFWDKDSGTILGASHNVTIEMSRHREIQAGLKYVRPPRQERPNIFRLKKEDFDAEVARLAEEPGARSTIEQWLIETFTGLGRHLAEELVQGAITASSGEGVSGAESLAPSLWQRIEEMQSLTVFRPRVRQDLSRFTVLSWWSDCADPGQWKAYPAVNDMVDDYFKQMEARERLHQMRERLLNDLRSECARVKTRLEAAESNMAQSPDPEQSKRYGDLVLAHLGEIHPGARQFACPDLYSESQSEVIIPLLPDLSASANAQVYYRQFAKGRARAKAALAARDDARARLNVITGQIEAAERAHGVDEIEAVRADFLGRSRRPEPPERRPTERARPKGKTRLLSVRSSDGLTIFVGRNRHENDELVGRIGQPHDLWLHVLGSGGAHVLVRMPPGGRDVPPATLREAAHAAARLSKAVAGGVVRVVYTPLRHVRKVPGNKPGVVQYENERTIEVDTGKPMPEVLKQLFARRQGGS